MDPKQIPQWLGRPITDDSHVASLETAAALHEFQNGLARPDAEAKAYQEYKITQRQKAAAHHLLGMRMAESAGDKENAFKHYVIYDTHMKALGLDSTGPVHPDINRHLEADDHKSPYRFKPHKGDLYSVQEAKKDEEPVQKSEVTKRELPPDNSPQLHGAVEGFMADLKTIPKGSPDRAKFITRNMSHAPFIAALKAHPQGAQMHQQLTAFMNSPGNAGFKPGAAVATAKSEIELELEQIRKGDLIQFPTQKKPEGHVKKLRAKAKVLPIKPKVEAKRQQQRQQVDNMLEGAFSAMAQDPGVQAAAKAREVKEKEQILKRGPQKFKRGHKVVINPESSAGKEGRIPANWIGTVTDHHDQYGHEWDPEPDMGGTGEDTRSAGPHHLYSVEWKTPQGDTHSDYVHQNDLALHTQK